MFEKNKSYRQNKKYNRNFNFTCSRLVKNVLHSDCNEDKTIKILIKKLQYWQIYTFAKRLKLRVFVLIEPLTKYGNN